MCLGLRVETHEGRVRVEVQQMLDTWDIETQRRRTGARALVTVFSDARTLLQSVIEDECVQDPCEQDPCELGGGAGRGIRARAVCERVFGCWQRNRDSERGRELILQLDWYFYLASCSSSSSSPIPA